MTLINIMKLTLSQMGEDPGAAEISEYRTLLTAYINEAYQSICRDKKQKYTEDVMGFSDGRASLSSFNKEVFRIISIIDENGSKLPFQVAADQVFITPVSDGTCTVAYLYLPERLASDKDEPDLTDSDCYLLADYAAYRGLSLGGKDRQKRGEFFLMRYLSGLNALGNHQTQISNKFS